MSTPTLSTQPVFLLDVNVLLALFDPMHVHHAAIRHWFASGAQAVATCPLSQLGFVRICSNPRYPNALDSPEQALGLLRAVHSNTRHVFWPDDVSLADEAFNLHPFRSHRETTDRYLVCARDFVRYPRNTLFQFYFKRALILRQAIASYLLAPTGRKVTAQGNALGLECTKLVSPEGAK